VREQQRRTRSASNPVIPEPPALDIAATIESFPRNARADALLALSDSQIQTLSRELQDEVRSLRGTLQTRQQPPERTASAARGAGSYLPISSYMHDMGRRVGAADFGDGQAFEMRRFIQMRHLNMIGGDDAGSADAHNVQQMENVFARSGRVRSQEVPLVRCPISATDVMIITSACCNFSLPRATFKLVTSLLRVSFFDPACISAFVSTCMSEVGAFNTHVSEAHVANIYRLIRSLCSAVMNPHEPVVFRSYARQLAALLDTYHPVLGQKFIRTLLHQASTHASTRHCLSDILHIFCNVLLNSLNRMGSQASEFAKAQKPARNAVIRHVSQVPDDGLMEHSDDIASAWIKSSLEPCDWIDPLDSSLFVSMIRAASEPDSSSDALELTSHLLRFHMRYDQFLADFLPAIENHVITLCDTMASCLASSTSNLSIVQLPADDIRLVRVLRIIGNCFDANSIQWAAKQELAFEGISNADDVTSSPLLKILLRVSEHPVWLRVGVSLKEQERSSSTRRSMNEGDAAVGEPAAEFQSSGLARLHGMLEAFFLIHKPMGKRFSDAVELMVKSRSGRGAISVRSEEPGVMIRSDSTMGIGHLGQMTSESVVSLQPSPPPDLPSSASQSMEPAERDEFNCGVNAFVEFVFTHVNVVNMFVRLNPSVLSSSLSIIQRLPILLDFENRKAHFRKELKKRDRSVGHSRAPLQLLVKRGQVYSDSFGHLNYRSADELKAKLSVKFEGEEGADYGGLTREWYLVLSREMLNPDIGLFVPSQGSKLAFQCNPASDVIFAQETFVHFRFVGRVVSKALYDNMLLDAHFTRAMYKAMLRLPISLSDVQDTEPEVFKSLDWLLHNDVSDLDLTFATERWGLFC